MKLSMNRIFLASCVGAAALGLSSCAKTEAKTPGPSPIALRVPEPPIRMTIPVPAEPPPPAPVVTEKPAPSIPAAPPRPRPTPTPAPTPAPPPVGAEPPPVVQAGGELEARARERLSVAEQNLAKVQPGSLAPAEREQYDFAQRFIRETKNALAVRNFVLAAASADKAATIAVLLVK